MDPKLSPLTLEGYLSSLTSNLHLPASVVDTFPYHISRPSFHRRGFSKPKTRLPSSTKRRKTHPTLANPTNKRLATVPELSLVTWSFYENGDMLVVWSNVTKNFAVTDAKEKRPRLLPEPISLPSTQDTAKKLAFSPVQSNAESESSLDDRLQLNSYLQESTGIYSSGTVSQLVTELALFLSTWGIETEDYYDIEQ